MRPALRLVLLAIAVLAACRGQDARAPFTDSRIPPGLEQRFYPPQGWAWGLLKTGDTPAARYGVSAPAHRPRADVLILTSYGESAEVWFETAADLNARGYVVWVLEPVGQGGSGRYGLPRDLGDAPGLEPDVAAATAAARTLIHRQPLIVLASGASAPVALAALRGGLNAEALILSSPSFGARPASSPWWARFGLDALRAQGGSGWRRDGPDDRALGLTHDAVRARLRLAWQTANPDLRMGGPSWRWHAAQAAQTTALLNLTLQSVTTPVLVLQPDTGPDTALVLCRRLRRCTLQPFGPAGASLHLEVDEVRRAWLSAVEAFVEQNIAGLVRTPPQATLAPEG